MMCRLALSSKKKKKKHVRQLFAMKHYCNNTDLQVPVVPFIWLCREIYFQERRASNEKERVEAREFMGSRLYLDRLSCLANHSMPLCQPALVRVKQLS